MKEKLKNRKGITLIALIVTIIVLLILAGISIGAITGDNGIIKQAKNAKNDTEYQQWEEQIDVAIVDAENKNKEPTMDDVIEELINKKVINDESQVDKTTGTITTNEPIYTIEDKLNDYIIIPFGPGQIAEKNETYTDKNEDTATIPKGFEVSENENEQTIDEGLVIKDEKGNEFVWIPVTDESQYVRNTTYEDTRVSTTAYTDTGYLPDGIQPDNDSSGSNEEAERKAVLNAKGFYISRYEAGKEGTDTLVSKKEATVWSNTKQPDCKNIAKEFVNNNNVKSALCSGIQWDVVMGFVNGKNDGNNKKYDVTSFEANRHTGSLAVSGKNPVDKVCNIYDLEGNYMEFVAEKTTAFTGRESNVTRGGFYRNIGYTASKRYYDGHGSDETYMISFRIVLYIM